MKTLTNFKDEYTQIDLKEPNGNWDEFVDFSNAEEIAKAIDIISERYANYKAEIAWEEGRQSSFWADQYPNTAKTTNPYKQ